MSKGVVEKKDSLGRKRDILRCQRIAHVIRTCFGELERTRSTFHLCHALTKHQHLQDEKKRRLAKSVEKKHARTTPCTLMHSITLFNINGRMSSRSSAVKPELWMIFICLTIVLFPLSPAPRRRSFTSLSSLRLSSLSCWSRAEKNSC